MKNFHEITNPDDKKYASVFQEYRRHFTVRKKIKNDFDDLEIAWQKLLKTIKRLYKISKSDDFYFGEKIKLGKDVLEVDRFTCDGKRKEIALNRWAQDKSYKNEQAVNKFTTGFVVRKKLFSKGVLIKYTEHVYAFEEMFGFRATLAKFGFKREIKKNKQFLEKEIKKS